jgi:hypothetical protein
MRKINILLLIFFLLQFPLEVEATSGGDGGWISSGGELFQDARNPWFVKNTKEVFWCLQVDGSQVSATENQIELAFVDAVEYWRKEAKTNRLSNNFFSIATQKFSRLPCMDSRVSLRVIFGKSLLNTKEREFLKDPDKYVGVTVRQEYNPVSLFGSGFIFFSADQDNLNKKIFPRVWSKEKIKPDPNKLTGLYSCLTVTPTYLSGSFKNSLSFVFRSDLPKITLKLTRLSMQGRRENF